MERGKVDVLEIDTSNCYILIFDLFYINLFIDNQKI